MNLLLIILIGSAALALVVLLIIRNKKYETYFEDNLDNDYVNGKEESGNHHVEEVADSVH